MTVRAPRAWRAGGFTLLELLVVVLLIGLLTSLAVLGVQGRSPLERQREEAQRLLARMELAREEAVLRASSLGIRFERDAYRFLGLEEQQWRRLRSDRLFRAHELPGDMRLTVDIDGLEIELAGGDATAADDTEADQPGESESEQSDAEQPKPQIFFLAGGEIVPDFTIRLTAEATRTEFVIEPGDATWLELSERDL